MSTTVPSRMDAIDRHRHWLPATRAGRATNLPDHLHSRGLRSRAGMARALHEGTVDVVFTNEKNPRTPLPKKLGIKEGLSVGLIGAPLGFERTLGALPAGAVTVREPRKSCDLVLCFAKSMRQMSSRMNKAMELSAHKGLWLIWLKESSGLVTDLSEQSVRRVGLAAGWVDYKVCAVDATWSGHKFARRE